MDLAASLCWRGRTIQRSAAVTRWLPGKDACFPYANLACLFLSLLLFVCHQSGNNAVAQWFETPLNPPDLVDLPSEWEQWVIPYDDADGYSTAGTHDVVHGTSLVDRIVSDHRNYYDAQSFRVLAGGFLIGAAFANTKLDQEIQDHFQSNMRSPSSDEAYEFLHANKDLGDGWYTLPVFATAWAVGTVFDEPPWLATTGRWGERSMRSFLVGAPPLILAQLATGGSRPGETDHDSRWRPFQDNNGVSGHSFMSALPFINAAKMTRAPVVEVGILPWLAAGAAFSHQRQRPLHVSSRPRLGDGFCRRIGNRSNREAESSTAFLSLLRQRWLRRHVRV